MAAGTPRPFIFVLHSHQPVGNFEHVFEDAFARSYQPFTEILAAHPGVKAGLHFTGPLLEWLAREHQGYLDDLRRLVERGQVEILGGGFYEPILSALSDADAAGQIEMMGKFCQRYFGHRPTGMWLAERVWDPDLPRVLAPAGIRYTLLDDSHFRAAGVAGETITGHYITEKAGHPLSIFPIDKGLRYRIPFAQVDEALNYLVHAPGAGCLTYGDDGEKFGLWPDTYDWVFNKKWLTQFFAALERAEADGRLRMVLPEAYLAEQPPVGRVYLPNASYDEMMEWALPVSGMRRLHELRERFKRSNEYDTYGAYLRGGIWQNFLAKYPEANQIHKKMLLVSGRLEAAMADAMEKSGKDQIDGNLGDLLGTAQRELYKGQCCCAYWHGLFGGLYLNYLRDALYRSLLTSERILDEVEHGKGDWLTHDAVDLDLDGRDEILVSNRLMNVYLRPHAGGSVFEVDYKPKSFHLTDVLTRREEGYHDLILAEAHRPDAQGGEGGKPKTIHDLVRMKEPHLERHLVYDDVPRASFVDRFFPKDATLDVIRGGAGKDLGDFASGEYKVESLGVEDAKKGTFHLTLCRRGTVRVHDAPGGFPVGVEKHFGLRVDAAEISVRYVLRNEGDRPVELCFGTEINVNLLAGNDPSRYLQLGGTGERFPISSDGVTLDVAKITMVDEWQKIRLELTANGPATLFRYPIETVSNSESGFERTFQGTCLAPSWTFRLAPGEKRELNLRLVLTDG